MHCRQCYAEQQAFQSSRESKMPASSGGAGKSIVAISSEVYSAASRVAICAWASAMLDLMGRSRMTCVAGLFRYSFKRLTAFGSAPRRAVRTLATISATRSGAAKACSASPLKLSADGSA